ncbi:hypothetical protein IFR04_001681 [Cadophora malorum]|uniref:MFS transporter n=1 Tax=Cadophora malorum TaxID=108018 RepID=A0A8H7WHQ6_9HELO|nr:hypothetical protein IFR04_001681 [Cadophora malorum]
MATRRDPEKFGVDTDVHLASPGKGDNIVHETESSPGRSLFNGTIKLTTTKGRKQKVVLIPQPTVDPRDPLNIAKWQKLLMLGLITFYSITGLCAINSLGALLVFFIPDYTVEGISMQRISGLITYPSLLVGLGNIVSMPLVLSIGRRPVYLASNLVLLIALILCATSKSFEWHFAARCIVAFAAAQSEATVPLIIQDIFFLHQRARAYQVWSSSQTLIQSALVMGSSYMTRDVGWRSWYGLLAAMAGASLILGFVFVPETYYDRPAEAWGAKDSLPSTREDLLDAENNNANLTTKKITEETRRSVDLANYPPRTLSSDLRVFVMKPDWSCVLRTLKQAVQLLAFPHVAWIALMNGVIIGFDISIIITYGPILVAPPYNWPETSVSLTQVGQFPVAFIAIPLLGWFADRSVVWMARRNGGVHEPEFRLLTLVFPLVLCMVLLIVYGLGAQNPFKYHWLAIVFPQDVILLVLFACNTVGLTYLLDAHPQRAGPICVVICVCRGLISFGVSRNTVTYVDNVGFLNLFGIYTGIVGVFAVMGVAVFVWGKKLRIFCARWAN